MAEDFDRLFAQVRAYGWDNEKRDRILRERGIDFEELRFLFEGPTIAHRSDRESEVRYKVYGFSTTWNWSLSAHSDLMCVGL